MMQCEWCQSNDTTQTTKEAYWELPDGLKAIQIHNIPSIHCQSCGMNYIEEALVEEIEDHLFLIHTQDLPNSIGYDALMSKPRTLKKNYFRM